MARLFFTLSKMKGFSDHRGMVVAALSDSAKRIEPITVIHVHPLIRDITCAILVRPSDPYILRKELKTWGKDWRIGATSLQITMILLITPTLLLARITSPSRSPVELDEGP